MLQNLQQDRTVPTRKLFATDAYMSQFDINVAIATDARQGLRLVDVYRPHAIVMDLHMPFMDGFQLCRRFKRDVDTAHIPVIMVTSSDSPQDALTSTKVGVDRYLLKDCNLPENLLKILQTWAIQKL